MSESLRHLCVPPCVRCVHCVPCLPLYVFHCAKIDSVLTQPTQGKKRIVGARLLRIKNNNNNLLLLVNISSVLNGCRALIKNRKNTLLISKHHTPEFTMKRVDECNQFLDTLTPIWIWVEVNFRKNNKLDK